MASPAFSDTADESCWLVANGTNIRLCRYNRTRHYLAYVANIKQDRPTYQSSKCSLHRHLSSLCYGSSCRRHRDLLEFFRTRSSPNIVPDWRLRFHDQCYYPFLGDGAADWTSGKIAHRRIRRNDKTGRHGQNSQASGNVHPACRRRWSYHTFS